MKITIYIENTDNLLAEKRLQLRREFTDVLEAEGGLRLMVEQYRATIRDHDCHLDPNGQGHCNNSAHFVGRNTVC